MQWIVHLTTIVQVHGTTLTVCFQFWSNRQFIWQSFDKLCNQDFSLIKFVFFKKATKFDEIFTVDLTLTAYCQIDSEDFFNVCDHLRKHEL